MDTKNEFENINIVFKRKFIGVDSDYNYEIECLRKENKILKTENNQLKCEIPLKEVKNMYTFEIDKMNEHILELEKKNFILQTYHSIDGMSEIKFMSVKEKLMQLLETESILRVDVLHKNEVLKKELQLKSAIYNEV
jgi:hypothetical protein